MDSKKILALVVVILAVIIGVKFFSSNFPLLITVSIGFMLFSLVFFSRGVLIFLTTLTLMLAASSSSGIKTATLQLRWVFLILCAFHVFGDILLGRTVRKIKMFDCFAIAFIFYAFLSVSYSPFRHLTLERATTLLLLYVSIFWIIWKYAYTEGPEKVVDLVLWATMLIVLASYLKLFIHPAQAFKLGRFAGIFGNPNTVGMTFSILLPLSIWQYFDTKKKAALFLFFLMLIGILLSASRSSINAMVVSMGYFIYARSEKYRPLVFFFSMSFILILAWIIETLLKQFFINYFRVETIPTAAGRIEFWSIGLGLISSRPIFGYGFGIEEKLFSLKHIIGYEGVEIHFHNSYLGMALQLGIIGFLIFFGPLFMLLFKEIFSRKSSDTLLRCALQASIIAGLVVSFFESWLYSVGNCQTFPFWIMVMLLVFYRHQDGKNSVLEGT